MHHNVVNTLTPLFVPGELFALLSLSKPLLTREMTRSLTLPALGSVPSPRIALAIWESKLGVTGRDPEIDDDESGDESWAKDFLSGDEDDSGEGVERCPVWTRDREPGGGVEGA